MKWARSGSRSCLGRTEDVAVLTADYFRRALQADVAAAELQVRTSPQDASAHNALALKYAQGRPFCRRANATRRSAATEAGRRGGAQQPRDGAAVTGTAR
jgi:hypothetical protein